MKPKTILAGILVAFVLVSIGLLAMQELRRGDTPVAPDETPLALDDPAPGDAPETKVVVYYFYGAPRCTSCKKIENWTSETVHKEFAAQLNDGSMEWTLVDYDKDENKHYMDKYELFTKSVVLVEFKNGKETRWKNLDNVWELLVSEAEFKAYIAGGINDFLAGKES